ncbi:hypothetical protein F0562_028650 [Nyssa sinensis]|uniref:Calmodulin-binding protein n=1 Tax=Nyssa sinensis TaxID=561372 RepID=A0A5J5B2V7_9ASTE|nr:hypothetical protein F0562_028650 [Nyssa sinensis]
MEMEVMIPSPAGDFNFDSACTSPYISAPSSPQRFGNFFFSAPTSPTRASSFYREFNNFSQISGDDTTTNADFEFDFSGQLERTSLSADELFDGGKIKPLKPPPRLQYSENGLRDSPKSPRSPISTKTFKEAFSPRHKKKDFDPFAAAMEQTRRESNNPEHTNQRQRGRERTHNSSSSSIREKGTRSLSPFRVCDFLFEREHNQQNVNSSINIDSKQSWSSFSAWTSSWKGYRKWRLKDLLLFRSASEGRATSKDHLKKYALLKKTSEDVKNSSFRSTDSVGSVSSSRRRGPVSAHELHYTVNRAVSEEMKKKTFLPYNRGLLGCLGFNPAVHEISRGFGL